MATTQGKYYAADQMLEISDPSCINLKDLVVKYSLNNKWKNPYVQLRVKYNNGGSVVQCTPSFLVGTSMRMSKMPQPGDVMGKKNAFLMAVPAKWIALFEEITDIIMHEMTKTTPIQRWDVSLKRNITEPNALVFLFGGVNPDQLFKHFPQAKPWVKEFGTQIKKAKMDTWTEAEWVKFSTYFRIMLGESEGGAAPAMKSLLIKPKEGNGRSMRITCKNMELGKAMLDDDGRPKPQTSFKDNDKGTMEPEAAIRQLTYDEHGADGLSMRGGDMPVVASVSLWWYWVNDKGVNPTMNINRIVYQVPKVLEMSTDDIDMDDYAELFQKPPARVFGDEEEEGHEIEAAATLSPPVSTAPPKTKRKSTRTTRKANAKKSSHRMSDEGPDDDFSGALDSDIDE